MSVLSPNGKSTATISAGITKKTASDRVPPTVCGGASSSRFRYRTMHQISSPSTARKTGTASSMMTRYS